MTGTSLSQERISPSDPIAQFAEFVDSSRDGFQELPSAGLAEQDQARSQKVVKLGFVQIMTGSELLVFQLPESLGVLRFDPAAYQVKNFGDPACTSGIERVLRVMNGEFAVLDLDAEYDFVVVIPAGKICNIPFGDVGLVDMTCVDAAE
ncbi:MAG: hypothetical protein M3552_03335 [Planctomycetota bacterium]|nr:hypothetical protein [Planctomycetota bacterium]